MKKVAAIALAAIVVLGAAVGCSVGAQSADDSKPAETVTVGSGEIVDIVSAQGSISADRSAVLVFASSGRIESVLVEEGDLVDEGQELAKLDGTSLEQRIDTAQLSLQSADARLAQTSVAASQAEIASAQAAVDSAKAGVVSAQARLEQLLNGPTESDIRSAELSIDSAKNQLWSAQASRDATAGSRMSSDANKDSAEAQVLIAEVAVQQAELAKERLYEPATEENLAIQRAALEQAEIQVRQAEAQLQQVLDRPREEDVAVAALQVAETKLALEQAQEALDDLVIEAPYAGTVIAVAIGEGEWGSVAAPAITVADSEHMVVEVRLDEADVAQLSLGQEAVLTFDALPGKSTKGQVAWIAPSATSTSSGTAYMVEIDVEKCDLPIMLGMTTSVEIITAKIGDAVLVPNEAITVDREAGTYTVFKHRALGEAEEVQFEVGLRDENYTQALSGVEAGDVLELPQYDLESDGSAPGFMPPMGGQR